MEPDSADWLLGEAFGENEGGADTPPPTLSPSSKPVFSWSFLGIAQSLLVFLLPLFLNRMREENLAFYTTIARALDVR